MAFERIGTSSYAKFASYCSIFALATALGNQEVSAQDEKPACERFGMCSRIIEITQDRTEVVAEPPIVTPPRWEIPIHMEVDRCTPLNVQGRPPSGGPGPSGSPLSFFCGDKPAFHRETIRIDSQGIAGAIISPSAEIEIGPIELKRTGRGGIANGTDTFRISVLARSPAVYTDTASGDAQFVGANRGLREVGFLETSVSGSATRTVYVKAKLPSVFNALKIVASVGEEDAEFPAQCNSLPNFSSTGVARDDLDSDCLHAVLAPSSVTNVDFLPIGIIYEPPGNCSWSRLTNETTSGVAVVTSSGTTTNTETLVDSGFFWEPSKSYNSVHRNSKNSAVELSVTESGAEGTELAGSSNNPGDPTCNVFGGVPAQRAHGPGFGETFVILPYAQFLTWHTAGLAASTLAPVDIPRLSSAPEGHNLEPLLVKAKELRGEGEITQGLDIPREARDAILALSPFQPDEGGSVKIDMDPERFIYLATKPLPANTGYEHTNERREDAFVETIQEYENKLSNSTNVDRDIALDLAMAGLTLAASKGLAAAASGSVKGFANYAEGEWQIPSDSDPALSDEEKSFGIFRKAAKDIKLNIPTLYRDTTTTSTTVFFTRSQAIMEKAGRALIQAFYIKDTARPMNVCIYYDRMFNSYAFVPAVVGVDNCKEMEFSDGV